MNPYIFRKEDIRGIVGRDWDPHDAYTIGSAFACYLREEGQTKVLLGRDNRISSQGIYENFLKGLVEAGMEVIDLGLTTTPQVYWARIRFEIPGAAIITGSHNPPEWNGLKLCFGGTTTIFGEELERIKALCFERAGYFKTFEGKGTLTSLETREEYLNDILEHLPEANTNLKPKVVADSGNGVAGPYIKELLLKLNCDIITLHSRPDGTFPNHLPDPSRGENILELVHAVVAHKADFGIAFDGDVDRINVVDENGFALWGDGVLAYLAKDIFDHSQEHVSKKILLNSQCSPAIYDITKKWGGDPAIIPTGHARASEEIMIRKASLAGEYKGHIFLNDRYYGFDDALYAAARVITAWRRFKGVKISSVTKAIDFYYSTGEISIPTTDARKFDLEREIERDLLGRTGIKANVYDGDIRVDFGDGSFGLARNSDTTPKFEVYAWAKDVKTLGKRRDFLVNLVQEKLLHDY